MLLGKNEALIFSSSQVAQAKSECMDLTTSVKYKTIALFTRHKLTRVRPGLKLSRVNFCRVITANPGSTCNLGQKSLATLRRKTSPASPLSMLLQWCRLFFRFLFLNLQNNIGQGVWGKRKPLSNVIVWDCLKELCKICSVVLRHVNQDSLAESRQGTAGSALTLHHILQLWNYTEIGVV